MHARATASAHFRSSTHGLRGRLSDNVTTRWPTLRRVSCSICQAERVVGIDAGTCGVCDCRGFDDVA
jgi:hypothetical protein